MGNNGRSWKETLAFVVHNDDSAHYGLATRTVRGRQ